ncbi:MAG: hypothetical protein Q8S13_09525 [Dehalococcoidia bacterium]|nr:hypothetical protein [Dehalococcoidia bacterium]
MSDWTRADRWRTELARTASAVPIDLIAEFGVALLGELGRRGTPHGALSPEVISVRREGSALRVRIDTASTDPTQETLLATGTKSMSAHPGTHYRAPEQFTTDTFDARADCFAVGVMLYELASGQLPFGQGTTAPFKVFLALKRGGFPSLRDLRRDVSETLVGVIERALALRPEERFDGVATMVSALRIIVRPPLAAPTPVGAKWGSSPTVVPPPARIAPDRSGVPLDPMRPLETGVLPVATQAAIAAHRASEAQPRPSAEQSAPLPTAGLPSRPVTTPNFAPQAAPPQVVAPVSSPPPREVPLPIRAIVEAVTRPESAAPTRTPSQPVPRAEPPVVATPQSAPVTRSPVVLAPPRVVEPPSRLIVVAPPPSVIKLPTAPAADEQPPRVGQRLGPLTDPTFEARPSQPERTQVTAPPTMEAPPPPPRPRVITAVTPPVVTRTPVEPLHIAPAAPSRFVEPLRMEPAAPWRPPAPPVIPPPSVVAPRVVREAPTVVAPAPLQQTLLERATEPKTPVPQPAEDTARKSAGEITPPDGNSNEPTRPLRSKDAIIIGSILLLLGAGAGLLVKLPSRVVKQAAADVCVPGPAMVCPPPPAPVAMPDPTPPAPVQCVPPKPSPKLTCFYDGLRGGQARYLRGDRSGALEAFQAAEQCMPRNPQLLKWIGRCHEELRDRGEARTYYERYIRRRPRADDADFYRTKVEALTRAPDGGTK